MMVMCRYDVKYKKYYFDFYNKDNDNVYSNSIYANGAILYENGEDEVIDRAENTEFNSIKDIEIFINRTIIFIEDRYERVRIKREEDKDFLERRKIFRADLKDTPPPLQRDRLILENAVMMKTIVYSNDYIIKYLAKHGFDK